MNETELLVTSLKREQFLSDKWEQIKSINNSLPTSSWDREDADILSEIEAVQRKLSDISDLIWRRKIEASSTANQACLSIEIKTSRASK
jgi:hypothetical protein